jgi:hypothetical protein
MNIPNGHVLRYSDSKYRKWVCINCDGDDRQGSMELYNPCPKPLGQGGITFEEWKMKKRRSRI